MATLIDYKKFGLSTKQIREQETFEYYQELLESGMNELNKYEFLSMLAELGYKIDNSCTFNYYNNLNEKSYLARSMSYTDIKTKQGYAHYEQAFTNAENLRKLQAIRYDCFVYENGRIWDL